MPTNGMTIPSTELNTGVKTYNLSSVGKALPAWVGAKKAAQISKKRKKESDDRLEVIQELYFPTASGRVKVSADGETMMATGTYPPQVRAYELRELSLKFSRHFTADVVQFQILSSDWKKAAFLLTDRTIEFHSQFGKHYSTRIPHFGRALAYQRETCELLAAGASEDIYRLNLERGCFLNPLRTGASGVNVLAVAPSHGMLAVGTQDGTVQCWDPRSRDHLGAVSPFDTPDVEALPGMSREVTSLRFGDSGLQLAAGTSSGHIALYDIRRMKPMLVKDHQYGAQAPVGQFTSGTVHSTVHLIVM